MTEEEEQDVCRRCGSVICYVLLAILASWLAEPIAKALAGG